MPYGRRRSAFQVSATIGALLCAIAYLSIFIVDLSPYWFDPHWTTDDAKQQVYPFYEVLFPGRFTGDIVTESMRAYFPPLHSLLGNVITSLTGDPIMMAHWMMFVQVASTALLIFFAVQRASGWMPACFSLIWFLHSFQLIQRLTGGLSRGWIAPLIAAYIYLLLADRRRYIVPLILIACLLNPLGALILIVAYGFFGGISYLAGFSERRRSFIAFLVACPVFLIVTLISVRRPPELGKMVSYEEAISRPEFSKQSGRFAIVPFLPVWQELSYYGTQVFVSNYYKGPKEIRRQTKWWKRNVQYIVPLLLLLFLFMASRRGQRVYGIELLSLLAGVLLCYFAARLFAFSLYIPSRYLKIPIGLFFIVSFPISIWGAFAPRRSMTSVHTDVAQRGHRLALLALLLFGGLVAFGSGDGLQKEGNFNFNTNQGTAVFHWIKENTPPTSVIAGQPQFLDPLQLVSVRRAYITHETAHPFYDKYWEIVKHRLMVSIKAHYAKSIKEFLEVVEGEKIDYFVFERARFYPDALKEASYFGEFDALIKEVTAGSPEQYAYRELPTEAGTAAFPALVYRDNNAVIVNVALLRDQIQKPATVALGESSPSQDLEQKRSEPSTQDAAPPS